MQWPTLLTLAMFPVLVWMYARLARMEEQEACDEFGTEYAAYASQVPRFIPRRNRRYDGPSGTKNIPNLVKGEDRSSMEVQETPL